MDWKWYIPLGCAVLFVAVNGGPWLWSKWLARKAKPVAVNHDAAPPKGAVEWVEQLVAAAGVNPPAEFLLLHVRKGSTAAQVMAARIEALAEVKPNVIGQLRGASQ